MSIKVNNAGYPTETTAPSNTSNTSGKTITNIPVGQSTENEHLKELYAKLGVTKEQFEKLCKSYPGFENMTFDEQLKIVNDNFKIETSEQKTSATQTVSNTSANTESNSSVEQSQTTSQASQATTSQATPQTTSQASQATTSQATPQTTSQASQAAQTTTSQATQENFNHKEFSTLSKEEKEKVLILELAKNKFIYGDSSKKRTIEDWNALSPEEQQSLIDDITRQFGAIKEKFPNAEDSDKDGKKFDWAMTVLQAANENSQNFKDFIEGYTDADERYLSAYHDYIFNVDPSMRSESQNKYIERQEFTSSAISYALNDSNDFVLILSPTQVKEKLEELGKTKEQVELEYLKSKGDKLTSKEANKKELLEKIVKRNENTIEEIEARAKDPSKRVDYGILKGMQDTKYGKDFNAAQTPEAKIKVLFKYMDEMTKDMNVDSKVQFMKQMLDELYNDPSNLEVINKLYIKMLFVNGAKERIAAQTDGVMPELNAANIDAYGDDPKCLKTMQEAQNKIAENDKERAVNLKLKTMENATDSQNVVLSEQYSGDESLDVQRQVKECALKAEKSEHQIAIVNNIKNNSADVVMAETAVRVDEFNVDVQADAVELLMENNQYVTKAVNESGVIAKLAKENQLRVVNNVKSNIEKLYSNDDEAIEQLNILSDQIKDLHKDNQLEAHTVMMSSKYSEVQEHTAKNICNYDPAVQSEAMDVVYQSGNTKAIQAAAEVINKMSSPNVQQTEIVRFAAEMALSNATDAEINAVISSGTLTAKEIRQLSSVEKREYFVKLFESAPPAKKIQMLMKFAELSGLANKRLIYTLIARTSMLTSVIESGMGETMLSAGLPVDAVNKILTVMKRSTNFQVKDQLEKVKQNSSYSQYFDKDELDEIKEKKEVPQDMKRAFTAPIDSKTKKKLQEQESTICLNS